MSTQFQPLEIPPGVLATATKKMRSTQWAEVNNVRWTEGQLSPIGGQAKYAYPNPFASPCRAVFGWYSLDQIYHIAYLCEGHLYVDTGGALTDISPLAPIVPPTPPTTGGYSDGLYGQGIFLAATAAFTTGSPNITMVANPGGVVSGMTVWNTTTNLNVGTVSTYSGTALVLTANAASASQGLADVLNFSGYGDKRAISNDVAIDRLPECYSLGNFGAILLAMTSADGRLLFWDPVAGGKAAVVVPKSGSTVPHGRCFVVTPERFVQIFGSVQDGTTPTGGSFRRMAWCNQEDYTDWSYTDPTTQAGFIDIEPASPIVTATATRNGTIFWTGKKAYVSRYLGLPYVYNYVELGDNVTPWSPQSIVTTSSMVLWMSQQGPYSFDGTSVLPIQCNVRAWVDDDVDLLNVRNYSHAVHIANFNEFWWFFPQQLSNSKTVYPTRAIVYNYKEGWWGQSRMARTAGVTASYTSHTIMANGGVAYEHEQGFIYNDADLPWAESFDLNGASSGARLTTIKQMIPDIEGAIGNVLYSIFYRNSRTLGTPELRTPPITVRQDGYVDLRVTGRDLRLRIDLAAPASFIVDPVNNVQSDGSVRPVTIGQHLVDSVPRGDR